MTFSFSIALAVFQQFELIWANHLNMELQMENVAGKLFHSQPFSLALLASGCATCFPRLLRRRGSGPRGPSAPSGHAGSRKDVGDLSAEDSTLCMSTFILPPVPCRSPGETRCATRQGNALPDPPRSYTPRIPLGRNGGRSRAATDTEFPL